MIDFPTLIIHAIQVRNWSSCKNNHKHEEHIDDWKGKTTSQYITKEGKLHVHLKV